MWNVLALLSFFSSAQAQTVRITDTTLGIAPTYPQYVGFSPGINTGFGDQIGFLSQLWVDSSTTQLAFALLAGPGNLNDHAVIYLDTVPLGFSDTIALNDQGDPGRQAITGNGPAGSNELIFAPGFEADYAILMTSTFTGLFQLNTGSLGFIANVTATPGSRNNEIVIDLPELGLTSGDTVRYVATLINPFSMFRADEYHGVSLSTSCLLYTSDAADE